jgi:hypothetical protein
VRFAVDPVGEEECVGVAIIAGVAEEADVGIKLARMPLDLGDHNLSNFMRTLAMPKAAEPWSLTSPGEPIKIGAKVVSHGRCVTFQIAEVAVPRQMFQEILSLIPRLRARPAPE